MEEVNLHKEENLSRATTGLRDDLVFSNKKCNCIFHAWNHRKRKCIFVYFAKYTCCRNAIIIDRTRI